MIKRSSVFLFGLVMAFFLVDVSMARAASRSRSNDYDEYQSDSPDGFESDSYDSSKPKKRQKATSDDYSSSDSEYPAPSSDDSPKKNRRNKARQTASDEEASSDVPEDDYSPKSRRSKSRQAVSEDSDYGYAEEEPAPRKNRSSRRRYASEEDEDGMGSSYERSHRSRRTGGLLHEILWANGGYYSQSPEHGTSTSNISASVGYLYHLGGGLQIGALVDFATAKDTSTTNLGLRGQYNLSPNIADSIFLFGQLKFGQTKVGSASRSLTAFGVGGGIKVPLVKHVSYNPYLAFESLTYKTTAASTSETDLTLAFLSFSFIF